MVYDLDTLAEVKDKLELKERLKTDKEVEVATYIWEKLYEKKDLLDLDKT